ncbi:MAG: B12-binding domain-containing radical SAM protein [Eubacteriales bacterium]|nr:B12-binding domain-containing radical SAM protein [Eubacteriales bacterium]
MKILLAACNAKYIHSNLAVYNLKAYAKAYQEHVFLREYTINQQRDDIMRDIYKSGADVVCFSCYIWNISFVKELLQDLAGIMPNTAFWTGGPEVSFDAEAFLTENPHVTGVMVGEGEETFLELVKYYVEKHCSKDDKKQADMSGNKGTYDTWHTEPHPGMEHIRGIVYRDQNGIHHNGCRETLDLSTVPFAYENLEDFSNRIIYYESSRGCPFSCSYCLSSVDKKLRFRSLELVKKELQFFIDHRVPQVKFVDRTFNCKHGHAMAIWQYITDHDNGVTNFHFEVSADLLREEELALMETMRPGLIQLEIGVQSTNPRTIRAIRRTMNLEKLSSIVARIHSFGNIHQHLDLIAGLPYEDYDSFRHSFNDVYAMRPQQLQLGFLKVLKGSYMMETAKEYGIIYKAREPYEVLCTNWLSYGEVLKLKMVESMVEVYYNSGQFQNTLFYLEPFFPDAFGFYEALGTFYEKKGYGEISHARMRRYEILLEFLEEYPQISREDAADKMIYDLYLRENLKSRPSFASLQKPWEKQIWEYRRLHHIPKTAHIEVFRNGQAVLFDYTRRDPLMRNACAENVEL